MLPTFANQTVRIVRPGTKEVRGVPVFDWDNTTEHDVTKCSVQPASTSRNFASARVLNIQDAYTLYAQPGADIQAGDRVEVNGKTYSVDGDAEVWRSPTGRVSNVQFLLRRWEG